MNESRRTIRRHVDCGSHHLVWDCPVYTKTEIALAISYYETRIEYEREGHVLLHWYDMLTCLLEILDDPYSEVLEQ